MSYFPVNQSVSQSVSDSVTRPSTINKKCDIYLGRSDACHRCFIYRIKSAQMNSHCWCDFFGVLFCFVLFLLVFYEFVCVVFVVFPIPTDVHKGSVMYYPVYGMVHLKDILLLIENNSPRSCGSGFPISLYSP